MNPISILTESIEGGYPKPRILYRQIRKENHNLYEDLITENWSGPWGVGCDDVDVTEVIALIAEYGINDDFLEKLIWQADQKLTVDRSKWIFQRKKTKFMISRFPARFSFWPRTFYHPGYEFHIYVFMPKSKIYQALAVATFGHWG